jgi:hypothetical protein
LSFTSALRLAADCVHKSIWPKQQKSNLVLCGEQSHVKIRAFSAPCCVPSDASFFASDTALESWSSREHSGATRVAFGQGDAELLQRKVAAAARSDPPAECIPAQSWFLRSLCRGMLGQTREHCPRKANWSISRRAAGLSEKKSLNAAFEKLLEPSVFFLFLEIQRDALRVLTKNFQELAQPLR